MSQKDKLFVLIGLAFGGVAGTVGVFLLGLPDWLISVSTIDWKTPATIVGSIGAFVWIYYTQKLTTTGRVVLFGALFLAMNTYGWSTAPFVPRTAMQACTGQPGDPPGELTYFAEQQITKRLRAPTTAKYPWDSELRVMVDGACNMTIDGYVDAQNGFGAIIRSNWEVVLEKIGKPGDLRYRVRSAVLDN